MKYVLVNGRTPCRQSYCVQCCEPIEATYLREIGTRLPYCNHDCYAAHCNGAIQLIENHSKAS